LALLEVSYHLERATKGRVETPRSLSIDTHIPYGIVIAAAALVSAGRLPLLN
jgi:hypothetical protein